MGAHDRRGDRQAEARIDAAVAEGALDPERAAELEEGLVERVTDLVNGELGPRRGIGFPRPRVP